ncbi:MAG: tetratricopeptide repeat protein, partial [Melioribacteraceae bacterium]|nr:tetratricopeptide repeat protein [Melioribacteraceae bacterium]
VILIFLLEFALRLTNCGVDTSTWIKVSNTHYGLNPKVAFRYFSSLENVPQSIQEVVSIKKESQSFRIFVLGGSSAAGYPYLPLGSFSRYIRQRLEHNYPEWSIEVVNLSLTAVNSYTVRDFTNDIIEQQPDLILIYAGHNEYYGALGIGSLESIGQSRSLTKLIIALNKFRITQLTRDIVKYLFSLISGDETQKSGTLMARMAEDQKIEFDSDKYIQGIEQFENNMREVVELAQKNEIPIILSTLVSNYKDQEPFISNENVTDKNARLIYNQAKVKLSSGNTIEANSLFRIAKDYDQLRFRAPEKINLIINQLGDEFAIPIVQADSILSQKSPSGIIGDELMIDHLHLNLRGYQDLGELFYTTMKEHNLIPSDNPVFSFDEQDSVTRKSFFFSELDSTIADFKIKLLKNDWPFTIHQKSQNIKSIIKLTSFIDTIAYKFVNGDEEWEKSHRLVALKYFQNGEFEKGKYETDLLIHQYPLTVEYNRFLAEELINRRRYDESVPYLERGNKLRSDDYFNKWLGIIDLSKGNVDTAIHFLEQSLNYNRKDAQVLYNLSGAYSKKKNYDEAIELINECLSLSPNYKAAIYLKNQLESINLSK